MLLAACPSTVNSRGAVSAAAATPSSTATPSSATPGAATSNGGLSGFDEFAFTAGELDEWGGHCGKADDYHYHVAPLHLQTTVGHAKPFAYALDGYALYGSLEPDGSALLPLDDYNGHTDSTGKCHYHGTTTYPYINGGLKGKVTVSQGGIETQPVTKPMRAPGDPLRGAVITMFETIAAGSYRHTYTLNGHSYRVTYQVTAKTVNFTFTDAAGNSFIETYKR